MSDRVDTVRLANDFARDLLRPIAISSVEQEGYRAPVRQQIAESRGRIKQKIKGVLLASGLRNRAACKNGRWSHPMISQRCQFHRNAE